MRPKIHWIGQLASLSDAELIHLLQNQLSCGAENAQRMLENAKMGLEDGKLCEIFSAHFFKVGEVKKGKDFYAKALEIYRRKRNYEKAWESILKYEDIFPRDFYSLITKLTCLVEQNNSTKLVEIYAELLRRLDLEKKKRSSIYFLLLREIHDLLGQKGEGIHTVEILGLWARCKKELLHAEKDFVQRKLDAEKENIFILYRDMIALSPDSLWIYQGLIETMDVFGDADLLKLTNFVEREYASEALKKGGELSKFLKKYKRKNSNSDEQLVGIDDLLSLDIDEEDAPHELKISDQREILLAQLADYRKNGKNVAALEIIQKLSELYPSDPIVKIVRLELLELERPASSTDVLPLQDASAIFSQQHRFSPEEITLLRQLELIIKKDDNEFHSLHWRDVCYMLLSFGLYDLVDQKLDQITEKIPEDDRELQEFLSAIYLRISAKILNQDLLAALALVESVTNMLPTNDAELVCFLYLEAEILFLLGKFTNAKKVLKEVSTISPNYRRVSEKLKALNAVK